MVGTVKGLPEVVVRTVSYFIAGLSFFNRRNTAWRKEVAPLTEDEMNNNDIYNVKPSSTRLARLETNDNATTSAPAVNDNEKKSSFKLERDDSVEELMKSIKATAATRKAKTDEELDREIESGRSTPEHLKKYSGTNLYDDDDGDKENRENEEEKEKRSRTFSETLKMLDDDIVAELNVK